MFDVIRAKPKLVLYIVGGAVFILQSFVHGSWCVPCLLDPTLALHKVHVLACIAQHLLAELAGNLAICQWKEKQSVFNTDVVCATPCSTETKDFSMHALLTLVLGRRME